MKPIEIVDFNKSKSRIYVVHNNHRTSPVVNDKGEFYISAAEASRKSNLVDTAVSGAIERKSEINGRSWRFATLDECLNKGFVLASVAAMKVKADDAAKAEKRKTEVVPKLAAATAPTLTKPAKADRERDHKPATFYGVKWPDGAITIRANHGSTWSMTRNSATDIPAEMLNECVWVNPNAST
jgi:hypothetical protein